MRGDANVTKLVGLQNARAPINSISPVVCVFLRMVSTNRYIRKYLKIRILPPLKKKDVTARPEVGDKLRNKLCALLTSPAANTDLVASLLFILCKESGKPYNSILSAYRWV